MSALDFYEQEHGTSQFLSKSAIVAMMEKFENYTKSQKADDDSHLRQSNPDNYNKISRFSVYFNNPF